MKTLVAIIGFAEQPWIDQAACRSTTTPDQWFPEPGHGVKDDVRALCHGCPVRFECLDYAVTWKIRYGVWGGLSFTERRRLHRRPVRRVS